LGRHHWAAVLAAALTLSISACGTETGVSSGATVSVYLSAPMRGPEAQRGRQLCSEAQRTLAAAGGEAGDLRVKLTCLDASGPTGTWTLAAVGANARRAVEDSTTVAYIAEPALDARRQSRLILEEAGIAVITPASGSSAMRQVLRAIVEADSGSLRESVSEDLSG
jgi:branched-chain amino acid transport system substrate-binding protein